MVSSSIKNIADTARERLLSSPHRSVHSVDCHFERGVLRLTGRLTSFYHKQLAQEAVAGLPGVQCVCNEVDVVDPRR